MRPENYQPHLPEHVRAWSPEEKFRINRLSLVYEIDDESGQTVIFYPGCRQYYLNEIKKMGYIIGYPLAGRYTSRWKKISDKRNGEVSAKKHESS